MGLSLPTHNSVSGSSQGDNHRRPEPEAVAPFSTTRGLNLMTGLPLVDDVSAAPTTVAGAPPPKPKRPDSIPLSVLEPSPSSSPAMARANPPASKQRALTPAEARANIVAARRAMARSAAPAPQPQGQSPLQRTATLRRPPGGRQLPQPQPPGEARRLQQRPPNNGHQAAGFNRQATLRRKPQAPRSTGVGWFESAKRAMGFGQQEMSSDA